MLNKLPIWFELFRKCVMQNMSWIQGMMWVQGHTFKLNNSNTYLRLIYTWFFEILFGLFAVAMCVVNSVRYVQFSEREKNLRICIMRYFGIVCISLYRTVNRARDDFWREGEIPIIHHYKLNTGCKEVSLTIQFKEASCIQWTYGSLADGMWKR